MCENLFLKLFFLEIMDFLTRIELIQLYYGNHCSPSATIRAYKTAKKLHDDSCIIKAISRLVDRFTATGSVHDRPRSRRPSLEEERAPIVEEELKHMQSKNDYSIVSSHTISCCTGIPQSIFFPTRFNFINNCVIFIGRKE